MTSLPLFEISNITSEGKSVRVKERTYSNIQAIFHLRRKLGFIFMFFLKKYFVQCWNKRFKNFLMQFFSALTSMRIIPQSFLFLKRSREEINRLWGTSKLFCSPNALKRFIEMVEKFLNYWKNVWETSYHSVLNFFVMWYISVPNGQFVSLCSSTCWEENISKIEKAIFELCLHPFS